MEAESIHKNGTSIASAIIINITYMITFEKTAFLCADFIYILLPVIPQLYAAYFFCPRNWISVTTSTSANSTIAIALE